MSLASFARSVALAGAVVFSAPAHAELIGITLNSSPDIFSGFIDVSYSAATDSFLAEGFSLSFDDGSSIEAISDGYFNISATIGDGGIFSSGSLTIEGSVGGFGPLLLTATLTDFGFLDPPGGDLFDFLFTVTGGELALPYFGGIGSTIGVVLDVNNGADFDGTFTTDFNNLVNGVPGSGLGVADTGVIPAPSALALLALGLLASRRRRAPG